MVNTCSLLSSFSFSYSELNFIFRVVFGRDFSGDYAYKAQLKDSEFSLLEKIHTLHQNGMPLEYILQRAQFCHLILKVNRNTLIPRPETETLAEHALKLIHKHTNINTILDLGTGSGAIVLFLASRVLRKVSLFASDISEKALEVAFENYEFVNPRQKVCLLCADVFKAIKHNSYDMVVVNPPYVEDAWWQKNKTLHFEPKTALLGGKNGLSVIKEVLKDAKRILRPGAFLVMEIGYNQKNAVVELAQKANLVAEEIVKDYNNIPRVLVMKKG